MVYLENFEVELSVMLSILPLESFLILPVEGTHPQETAFILADFYRVVLQMLSPTKGTQDRESSQLLHPFDLAFNKKRSKAESLFRLH